MNFALIFYAFEKYNNFQDSGFSKAAILGKK